MDIRNGIDGLKTLLGVSQPAPVSTPPAKSNSVEENNGQWTDVATLSSAGSEVSQTAGDGSVRADKVAEIQAKLAAGTYNIPASAVASKAVDAMLEDGQ